MYSLSLREYLALDFGVTVEEYSYGSLLQPGYADTGTEIGRYVSVGPNVRRFGAAHPVSSVTMHPLFYNPRLGLDVLDVERTRCRIESDAWVGANTVILPGCERIGFGAVIGAGSVVTRSIPDFAVAYGNPARVVRMRFDEGRARELLAESPWELEPSELLERIKG